MFAASMMVLADEVVKAAQERKEATAEVCSNLP